MGADGQVVSLRVPHLALRRDLWEIGLALAQVFIVRLQGLNDITVLDMTKILLLVPFLCH